MAAMLQHRVDFTQWGSNRLSHYPLQSSCMYETQQTVSPYSSNVGNNQLQQQMNFASLYQPSSQWPSSQTWPNLAHSNFASNFAATPQTPPQLQSSTMSHWQQQPGNQFASNPWQPNNNHEQTVATGSWQPYNMSNVAPKQEPTGTCTQDFIESFFTDIPVVEPQVTMPANASMLTSPLEANPIQSFLNGKSTECSERYHIQRTLSLGQSRTAKKKLF